MAKGLRSKVKRANRATLREQLTIPLQKKRQEAIAKKIIDDLNTSTNALNTLRSTLQKDAKKSNTDTTDATDSMVTDKVIDAPKEKETKVEIITQERSNRKRTGSKPRNNPNKELVWFK